ncbi:polar amino acid transport system permease protein [Bradyrhizobium macuxiense]|uniref:Polar amino acid transport system permease protein n=1 Tax=Bradyrhizobium macuxiense TaxID=1755647 RepID=A0A560KS08_9BRAD|nr:amino acid ABC transporter permease [Bradyrhizobium macuxiense]TWB86016.1 polar amino acid transport system permease protein [Bradyrhizobium macuxiense]
MSKVIDFYAEWAPLMLGGVLNTLKLFFATFFLIVICSIIVGCARLSRSVTLRAVATAYVEFFRGVSSLVVMFWMYYALPFLGVSLSAWTVAVLSLVLVHSAFCSEYVRSTVLAIPRSQHEAAQALSMNAYQRYRYVLLPQALAAMLPLFNNEIVFLLKGTSVASLVTIPEVTSVGYSIVTRTYQGTLVFGLILVIYFVLAQALTLIAREVEVYLTRWRSPHELVRAERRRLSIRSLLQRRVMQS